MTPRNTLRTAVLVCGTASLVWVGAAPAAAQAPSPSPPAQIGQDELDLAARANVVQGSGARAIGMGGAFLARADDATAASWNPAGLSYLRLPEVSFVFSANEFESNEFSYPDRVRDDHRQGRTPDFFAAAYPFRIRGVGVVAQASYQRLISFTSDRTIDEPTSGRFSTITSRGGFDVVALGTGFEIRTLRIGGTLNRWFNGYEQHRETQRPCAPPPGVCRGDTFQDANYEIRGWNVNLGVIWSPNEQLNLGAVFKSAFSADVDLSRERVDAIPVSSNAATDAELGLATLLRFPASLGVGASWRPRSALTVSADYTRTLWSKARILDFFTLPARGTPTLPGSIFGELPYPGLDPLERQHDTQQMRLGLEYVVIRSRLKLPLRMGAFVDRQYFADYRERAPWFVGVCAGAGVIVGPVLLDAAYVYESGFYSDQENEAFFRVSVRSHRVYASLIYRHGQHR